ncbi:pyridoxamine 5'-phosphate oxidase family protein [Nonomuraea fuscirosea]|uniref:pyridoxamine 5'-phosphate oxidase family protein n=1 Tax=Nonomuraea fuscirosea TaxID=1291556 RepID=UPI0033E287B2
MSVAREAGDIAAALTQDRHSSQSYQLTCPHAISFGKTADLAGKTAERMVRHINVAAVGTPPHSLSDGPGRCVDTGSASPPLPDPPRSKRSPRGAMTVNVKEPAAEQVLGVDGERPAPWAEARERLAGAHAYWTATNHPSGQPHVRPVFAVWVDEALYLSSDPTARKSRNLDGDAHCSIATSCHDLDLVVEGKAERVTDPRRLQRIAAAYKAKYNWPVTVDGAALTAPYAAPTAGEGPFAVYEVDPVIVFGFPTSGKFAPTRWRF